MFLSTPIVLRLILPLLPSVIWCCRVGADRRVCRKRQQRDPTSITTNCSGAPVAGLTHPPTPDPSRYTRFQPRIEITQLLQNPVDRLLPTQIQYSPHQER